MGTTRLQGVGIVPTISNRKIKVGDRLVYNFGHIYEVVDVIKTTKASRLLQIRDEESGELYEKRFLNSGHWAVVDENNKFRKN